MIQQNTDTAKYKIENRLTPTIAKHGFTAVPQSLLENAASLKISSSETVFLIQLMSFKWDKGLPFPSYGHLAKRMDMTETAVRNHARSLEKKNLIRRISRKGDSNQFDLAPLFTALESIIADQAANGKK